MIFGFVAILACEFSCAIFPAAQLQYSIVCLTVNPRCGHKLRPEIQPLTFKCPVLNCQFQDLVIPVCDILENNNGSITYEPGTFFTGLQKLAVLWLDQSSFWKIYPFD